jgi:anti-anti-sigma factor
MAPNAKSEVRPFMTVSIDSAPSGYPPRHGSGVDCAGAQLRAQCRHLATVVTISGAVDLKNIDQVSEYSRRFILPDKAFVLDLRGVDYFASEGVTFLQRIDEDCRAAGMEWALVASPVVNRVLRIVDEEASFPGAASVHEALHNFADTISARRTLLLPLLKKTA